LDLLEQDVKTFVSVIYRDLLDFAVAYVAGEDGFDIFETAVYVAGIALCEHFDPAVGQVANEAGESEAAGDSMRGEPETDALDPAGEKYVFGYFLHIDNLIVSYHTGIKNLYKILTCLV
jgi:hypothetical protein